MEIIKYDNALKGKNSDKCKTLEYSFNDKEIDLGIATINGRYPDKGYGVNLVSTQDKNTSRTVRAGSEKSAAGHHHVPRADGGTGASALSR